MDDTRIENELRTARMSLAPPEPAYERLLRRRDRKRRNARVLSGVTALLVTGGAVLGIVLAFGVHAKTGGVPNVPAANPVDPSIVAGPGQYYYSKREHVVPGANVVDEVWWGADGSGRYEVDSTNPRYGTPNSQTWGPDGPREGSLPFEVDASGLSTDPHELVQQLLERSSPDGESPEPAVTLSEGLSPDTSQLWRTIQNLIEQVDATPPLQAALFEVATRLPGVITDQQAVDPVGRAAVSVSVHLGDYYCDEIGGVDRMWFDPTTHVLLGSDGDLGCSPSTVIVDGGIVNSRSDVPHGDERLIPAPGYPVPEPSVTESS